MFRYGENYVEKGIEHYEEKFRLQRIWTQWEMTGAFSKAALLRGLVRILR
jgi:hypothetical protein